MGNPDSGCFQQEMSARSCHLCRERSIELVKWVNGYETEIPQLECKNFAAELSAGGGFFGCAGRVDRSLVHADRAGGCASIATGFACCSRTRCEHDSSYAGAKAGEGALEGPHSWPCVMVWRCLQRSQDGERRAVRHVRHDRLSSIASFRVDGEGGEPVEQARGSGEDYRPRRPGEGGPCDRPFLWCGAEAGHDPFGFGEGRSGSAFAGAWAGRQVGTATL